MWYHHNGLKPWDNAAAFLIVQEAGGKVLDLSGKSAKYTTNSVIIGTPIIVDKLNSIFSKYSKMQ
jgi:fructose-1,6-bisphosphatase/inositol monophosphatase family enzyme